MVTGDSAVGEVIDWLQRNTSMLQYDGIQRFHFWDIFRNFLQWEMDREYTPEKQRAIFDRGGLYYELNGQSALALECYTKAGDHAKVSDLLIRNAEYHPGTGHYEEMERYYRALPEEEILVSPALMQAMCMLCALEMEYEESERWYQALADFAARCERTDAARKQARSRLAWLDIALPQRGVTGLIDTIPKVFRLLTNREIALPPFSVTSMQPSILNGGKDFSAWSKKDDLLYQTIRLPVEAVLGKDGVGLPDCAIAESKFEQGEDVSTRMLALMSKLNDIHRRGTPDIEFAVVGMLVRYQTSVGRALDARTTLESLRKRFVEVNEERFLPNIDAMLCRIDLREGELVAVGDWYRDKAPKGQNPFADHEALPVPDPGHGGDRPGQQPGGPADLGGAGALLHRLPAPHRWHPPASLDGHRPPPPERRDLVPGPLPGPGHGGRVPLPPPGELLRRVDPASAGKMRLGGAPGLPQAECRLRQGPGGQLPGFPPPALVPGRVPHLDGAASAQASLRRPEQRGDRRNFRHQAGHREESRQSYPAKTGRETPQ